MIRMPGRYVAAVTGALLVASSPLAGVHAATRSVSVGEPVAHAAAAPRPSATAWGLPWLAMTPTGPASAQVQNVFSILDGVFCTSAASCWAVGEKASGKAMVNQVLHWNGKSWRKVAVPSPGGTAADDLSELTAVRCRAARDCWAVGDYSKAGTYSRNEALHWNGKKWSKVATPEPGGTMTGDVSELFDSTCVSSAKCWAVGDYGTSGIAAKRRNQILHWNGRHWSGVRSPNPAGTRIGHENSLYAVRCLSAANCLAVGDYGTTSASTDVIRNEALRWNGRKWSQLSTPNPGGTASGHFSTLGALACGSSTSCWSAGSYGSYVPTETFRNQILHWTGSKWTKFVTPNPGGTSTGGLSELAGATCTSSRNCWAVGTYRNGAGAFVNEALHWNGRRWSLVHAPNPGGTAKDEVNVLYAVRCTSKANCWAVGFREATSPPFQDEILHWNGKKWSVR